MYTPLLLWSKRERRINRKGYVEIKVPEHPRATRGGWVYEHRLVMESHLNRILKPYETVHHISEIKTQNSIDNLFVCTEREHLYAHALTLAVA